MGTKFAARLAIGVAGSVLALALAGCTSGAPTPSASNDTESSSPSPTATASGSQSKAEACMILSTAMADLSTALNESMQGMQSDPAAAAAGIEPAIDEFDVAVAEVTNDEVLAAGQKASDTLHAFSELFTATLANPTDSAGLMESAGAVQSDLLAIATTCAP